MAVTYANTTILYRGPYTLIYTEVTLDTSYPADGESIVPADVGLREFAMILPASSEGFTVEAVRSSPTAGLIKVFASLTPDTNSATSVPLESSVGRDLSALTVDLLIVGR